MTVPGHQLVGGTDIQTQAVWFPSLLLSTHLVPFALFAKLKLSEYSNLYYFDPGKIRLVKTL